MNHYLIVCRSVTYAQRMMRTLQRAALASYHADPQGLVPSGCGYAVRIREGDLSQALRAIGQINMRPVALFLDDGISYTEVPL